MIDLGQTNTLLLKDLYDNGNNYLFNINRSNYTYIMQEQEEVTPQEGAEEPIDPWNPQRYPNEEFWAYKQRMKMTNTAMRIYKRGQLVWDTKTRGTYIKPKGR